MQADKEEADPVKLGLGTQIPILCKKHGIHLRCVDDQPISKSIVWYEIDPQDPKAALDVLAKRIMKDVEVDDVSWKAPQYGIDPVKLSIGCIV